jgi:D-xylose transport system substrate-binding protein
MGRRWTAFLAVGLLVATTGGCGGSLEIAVLLPENFGHWQDHARFLEEAFDEAGVEYEVNFAARNYAIQRGQVVYVIDKGAEVLLMVRAEPDRGQDLIAMAHEADRLVIDYDLLTTEGPGADAWVGFDRVTMGRLMGETLEPAIDALDAVQPQIAFLNGPSSDGFATLLAEGYHEIADPRISAGDWALAGEEDVPNWDPSEAGDLLEEILVDTNDQVDAIFAANDDLAGAVVGVLENESLEPMPLSGKDATVAGIQHILAGWQTMTVYRPIPEQAALAADAALALLDGEDPGTLSEHTFNNGENDIPFVQVPPLAVTADNIEETVITDGFLTWEEICVGDWAQYCPPEHQR